MFHCTDTGNAEYFAAQFGDLVRFDHLRKRWLRWDVHRWVPDDDAAICRMAIQSIRRRRAAALEALDAGINPDGARAVIKHALASESGRAITSLLSLASAQIGIADNGKGWDETPGLLGVQNGVVDLRTGELRDGRPGDRITRQVPVAYDAEAECPRFRRFLREVFDTSDADETDEVVRYVRRLLGYGLTAECSEQKVVVLMGVGGNGKSTLLTVYRLIAGDYGIEIAPTVVKRTRSDQHPTDVAALEGARFASCEEVGDAKLNSDRLKHLSGGTTVAARRMHQDMREFPPTWQLWLTTNGQPETDDNSWAFWRRIVVLDFPNRFDPEVEPDLLATLKRELPGILAGIVRGAVEWYAEGLGPVPESVRYRTQQYREDTDPLESVFEAGVLEADESAWTATVKLFEAYQRWANDAGVQHPWSVDRFAKTLATRGFKRERGRDANRQQRGFVGVKPGWHAAAALPV